MNRFLLILRNTLLVINLLFAFLFLISCLAPYISPRAFWPVAFIGFGFLPLLFANIFWILFWLLIKWRFSFISIIALLISWWNISSHFNLSGCRNRPDRGSRSIMTFNVKVFNLYDWTHNVPSKNAILDVIAEADPDIVCLQEFFTDDSEQFNTVSFLKKTYPYFHFHKTLSFNNHNHWGIATFSKYPIVHRDSILFKDVQHNLVILSDVVIENDTFRIFNAHLQSIYLGPEEYRGMQHFKKRSELEFVFLRIIGKMHKAFMKRATQAETLAAEIARSPFKVLLAGDFNDTPNSYTYRVISSGLTDSFKEHGCLMGRTYSKPAIFRIDYILGDPRIDFKSHRVIWNNESDHYAVKATFD